MATNGNQKHCFSAIFDLRSSIVKALYILFHSIFLSSSKCKKVKLTSADQENFVGGGGGGCGGGEGYGVRF